MSDRLAGYDHIVGVWVFYPCGGSRRIGVPVVDLYDADGVNVDVSQRFAKPPPPCECGCPHASQGMPTTKALEGYRRKHGGKP